jgi:hypothetical protein
VLKIGIGTLYTPPTALERMPVKTPNIPIHSHYSLHLELAKK